jgi:SNF2 family DNA or RNA helicase
MSHSNLLNGHCDLLIFDEGHRLKNEKTKTL